MRQKYDCLSVLSKSERDSEYRYGTLVIYSDINLLYHENRHKNCLLVFLLRLQCFLQEASSTEFLPNSCLAAFNILVCFSLGKFKKVVVGIFSDLSLFMHSMFVLFVFLQSIRILEFPLTNHTS